MKRGPGLFLAMAILLVGLAVVTDGLSRVACICATVTCLIAWLKPTNRKDGKR
ncbi:hypothetical protein OHB44_28105 [Micromonospora sp. NBC_00821]|uniref:hypothetical protein n=1 Tax=Micromonospora sp. NBC_00821 TaxID=2975977 RepID=UPI002ED6B152|nr:hypothetical protein OHB44_28105 [Micromonospora sp. NBC_00821]